MTVNLRRNIVIFSGTLLPVVLLGLSGYFKWGGSGNEKAVYFLAIILLAGFAFLIVRQLQHSKKANETLGNSPEKSTDFKSLFESVPDLYLILRPDLMIDGVSDEYLRATMTKREEIVGRHLFAVFPDNPDDPSADGVRNLHASLNRVLQNKAADTMAIQKYDIRKPDGTFEVRYWSPLNKPVLDALGEVTYIVHSVKDVTQRVNDESEIIRSAAEIKELYDKAPCGYLSVDAGILLCNINQTLLHWLGYTVDEVVGKMKYEDLLTPESRAVHLNSFDEVYAGYLANGYVNDLEYEFMRKDGTSFPAIVNSVAVFDESGNFVKSRTTVSDHTEMKKATAQLKAANKDMESFSYSVSHDLRAPLRAINGYSGILASDYADCLNEDAQSMLQGIQVNAKYMGQLIDDLLSFSQMGRAGLERRPLAMKELVGVVIDELKKGDTNFKATIAVDDLKPACADAGLMHQVWVNLLSNAIKYSGKSKSPFIKIGMKEAPGENIYYLKDNGVGFDMKYYHKLFNVFQRLHKTSDFEGTGVGLALVHSVITKHGGRVWAEGKVNEGATFYFSLPEKV